MTRNLAPKPISDKQVAFIRTLLADRQPDEGLRLEADEVLGCGYGREASGIIDRLLNAPHAGQQRQRSVIVTEPGVYRHDGVVFIVKPTRETAKLDPSEQRLYAKRLVEINAQRATEAGERVEIEFEYDKGAIFDLDPSEKMPLDEAKALTIRYGRCIVCGRRLKAAESVERGIGPVCRRYFGSEWVPEPVVLYEGQREGAGGGIYGPGGHMIAGPVEVAS